MSFVGIIKKLQIQSVKFIPGSFDNIDRIVSVYNFFLSFVNFKPQTLRTSSVHDAMKMAAARPQLVVSADLITFAQNVRVTGWTMEQEGKTVLLFMIL